MTDKTWEDKYNEIAQQVCERDYHLITAMVATTAILNPNYSPAKPNDIVEITKELIHSSLDLEKEFGRIEKKYDTWKSSMEILSEWNIELEEENKELKYQLEK